ncbi:MAG TPA: FAD-dependent oxidoreductase [Terriglobia bacterium]|nr:FAD-dependent oxidoreductase [Terriglobia bacterium]
MIATGSSPVRPAIFPFEHPRIYDSDEILSLEGMPQRLEVVGAGVIGSEYACTFAAPGIEVYSSTAAECRSHSSMQRFLAHWPMQWWATELSSDGTAVLPDVMPRPFDRSRNSIFHMSAPPAVRMLLWDRSGDLTNPCHLENTQ